MRSPARLLRCSAPAASCGLQLREVHAMLIPGTAPPQSASAADLNAMGEGERAIFGGEFEAEHEFQEFAEPEGKTGHITNWQAEAASAGGARRSGHVRAGSTMNKCADPRCMSFAVRNLYCLRHVWQDGRKAEAPASTRLTSVFDELISAETKYNQSLHAALHYFHDRLRLLVRLEKPLIGASEIDRIFMNLNELHRVSEDLLSDLRELKSHKKLLSHTGAVFLHYTPLFEVYRKYCSVRDVCVRVLPAAAEQMNR